MFAKTFALCSLVWGDLFLSRRNKNICELAFDSWTATYGWGGIVQNFILIWVQRRETLLVEWPGKATLNSFFQDLLWRMVGCICFDFPPCNAAAWIGTKSRLDAGAIWRGYPHEPRQLTSSVGWELSLKVSCVIVTTWHLEHLSDLWNIQ